MPRIPFSLDAASAAGAAKQLRAYADMVTKKSELLREKLAEHIRENAEAGFRAAKNSGPGQAADIQVLVEHRGHTSVISVQGTDAVLLEYGPGVSTGGSAGGTRTNAEDSIKPGSTAAAMPLYRSAEDARAVFRDLAREVFS